MVEYQQTLDAIFGSLADPTRRDILRRVAKEKLSVGEIAAPYQLTFAGVSKHLQVLLRAKLIRKEKRGREQYVEAVPKGLRDADRYLAHYRKLWEGRFDRLEKLLTEV